MDHLQDIQIIDYQPGDYDKLVEIWESAGLSYKPSGRDSRERIEQETGLDCNRFLFARQEEMLVGTILVTHDGRKGWINRVAVLPEFRGRGIARMLVKYAEEWLDSEGIGIYACQVEPGNPGSLEVFKRLDYIPFEGMHYLTKRKFPEF
jgi:GNAT superfamily N-acetyltransferase